MWKCFFHASGAALLWICWCFPLEAVIGYTWFVPEEERHDSALKRNKEALATELRLWEGYLQKVVHSHQRYDLTAPSLVNIFHPFLSSWAPTLTFRGSPSRWPTWHFFRLLPLSSGLGEWQKCVAVSRCLAVSATEVSPVFCSGCLLSVTLNWEVITLCWRTGLASKPAGLLTGWRTWRAKTTSKTSETLTACTVRH